MKAKTPKRSWSRRKRRTTTMKGSLTSHLAVQLGQVSFKLPREPSSSFSDPPSIDALIPDSNPPSSSTIDFTLDATADDKDFILSQDFFCTPDYITPDSQYISNNIGNKENFLCPKSPEKSKSVKRQHDNISAYPISSNLSFLDQDVDLGVENLDEDDAKIDTMEIQRKHNYVSQSAVALRCRVMPPPCITNPYLKDASETDIDPFSNQRSKCAVIFPSVTTGDGISRYRSEFHEIEKIGNGNFSNVFKVLKRIDGCMYAVKKSTRVLTKDTERMKALMEVQSLAALGFHENLVAYYTSWFENEQLFIQMELCSHNLSNCSPPMFCTEGEILEAMHQIGKALQFIHERGIAHLDVKPENIYIKNGVYKLGDFGCATLIDRSLSIEEGDARYMPREIFNDNYDNLDKVDIFSLGITIFELIRGGTPLPKSGPLFLNLREGKLPLLPGHSVQFQTLLKAMMDPDPTRRPSAKELVENPIFDRCQRRVKGN